MCERSLSFFAMAWAHEASFHVRQVSKYLIGDQ